MSHSAMPAAESVYETLLRMGIPVRLKEADGLTADSALASNAVDSPDPSSYLSQQEQIQFALHQTSMASVPLRSGHPPLPAWTAQQSALPSSPPGVHQQRPLPGYGNPDSFLMHAVEAGMSQMHVSVPDASSVKASNELQPAPVDANSSVWAARQQPLCPPNSLPPPVYLDSALTDEMMQLMVTQLVPTEREVAAMDRTVARLNAVLRACFQGRATLHSFGSTASGMWLRGSADMDLCLTLDPSLADQFQHTVSDTNRELEAYNAEVAEQLKQLREERRKKRKEQSRSAVSVNDAALDGAGLEQTNGATEVDEGDENSERLRYKPLITLSHLVLERLADAMEQAQNYDQVKLLSRTRIPIIKAVDRETQVSVDVGFNNMLAVHNTRLLHTYTLLDSRFKMLAMIIKHWSKQRSINDTYSGTLSSYAYILMLLFYLQNVCDPPVLPNLQQLPSPEVLLHPSLLPYLSSVPASRLAQWSTRENWLRPLGGPEDPDFNVYFLDDPFVLAACWEQQNHQSPGMLLYGFFRYWAHFFQYKHEVASVRLGRILTKEEKNWVPLIHQKKKEGDPGTAEQDGQGDGKPGSAAVSKENDPAEDDDPHDETGPESTDAVQHDPDQDGSEAQSSAEMKKRGPIQRYWLCVEDPFEIAHNLGRPVGRDSLYFIRGEFLKAHSLLNSQRSYSRAYLNQLMNPQYTMEWHRTSTELAPKLLGELCLETRFKTREEHKQRNLRNMEFSERRRQLKSAEERNVNRVALGEFMSASTLSAHRWGTSGTAVASNGRGQQQQSTSDVAMRSLKPGRRGRGHGGMRQDK